MEALARAESERSPESLVGVFAPDAELWSVAKANTRKGTEGVREFWAAYLDAFRSVHSKFTSVLVEHGRAALEWQTEAVLASGRRLTYSGVSLLDLDGDRVTGFRTYFDPRPFLPSHGVH